MAKARLATSEAGRKQHNDRGPKRFGMKGRKWIKP
jgi:hypothetical protein